MSGTDVDDADVFRPDSAEFRRVLGCFATGIAIISSCDDGEPVGVAANSFTSVSLDPPLVLFCIARTSMTWPRLERTRHFAVNILGEDQAELSDRFSTRGEDRFRRLRWRAGPSGSPVLQDCIAYLDCKFWAEYDGGDHIIAVGRVIDLGVHHAGKPLIFYGGDYGRIASASP